MGPTSDSSNRLEAIRTAIQAVREEPLHDWVAVAFWNDAASGPVVYGERNALQLKGYLHSAIWTVAHGMPQDSLTVDVDEAADVRTFPKGRMDVVRLSGSTVGRGTFEPGWRWSESVAPIVGTDTCELPHMGYVISGRMMISPGNEEDYEIAAGDAVNIVPDHDAWTIGDEPCVIIEILSAERYGRVAADGSSA